MSTKKHFIAAASAVAAVENESKRRELANHHAALFSAENPRFDKARFFNACNVGEKKGGAK